MNDWKWASVNGCPERMIAAKSHSINSEAVRVEVNQGDERNSPSYRYVSLKSAGRGISISYKHVIYACQSTSCIAVNARRRRTLRWPRKCCSSLISLRARFARIFLLNTLVTFLMATPSPVTVSVAELERGRQHARKWYK